MMVFSEKQIDYILEKAQTSWKHNRISNARKENFMLSLKMYLLASGILEGVCQKCLGSGKDKMKTIIIILTLIISTSVCMAEKKVTYLAYQNVNGTTYKDIKVTYCSDTLISSGGVFLIYKWVKNKHGDLKEKIVMQIKSEYIVVEDVVIKPRK